MQHNSLSPSDIMYSKYFEAPKLLEISYPSKIDVHSLIRFSQNRNTLSTVLYNLFNPIYSKAANSTRSQHLVDTQSTPILSGNHLIGLASQMHSEDTRVENFESYLIFSRTFQRQKICRIVIPCFELRSGTQATCRICLYVMSYNI